MKKRSVSWIIPPLLAAALFVVDRLTKSFFLNHPFSLYPVLDGWFWLKFQLNTDMAFSLPLLPVLYYSLVGLVLLVLGWKGVAFWAQQKFGEFLCVVIILAGAISNLLDRIYFGGVIDFVAGKLGHVFNLADAMIVMSVISWMIILWKHDRQKTVQTHS